GASGTSSELGDTSSAVLACVTGSKRTTVPEQLFAAGPQPARLLVQRGPELIVIHTPRSLSACGLATCTDPLGTFANASSRRPSLSENCSSTVVLPQAHAGHSEMNDP